LEGNHQLISRRIRHVQGLGLQERDQEKRIQRKAYLLMRILRWNRSKRR
jgi:hypothetical protein